MNRLFTACFIVLAIFAVSSSSIMGQTARRAKGTEVIGRAPAMKVGNGVFVQAPQYVESFKGGQNSPLAKSEELSYFDPSVLDGHYLSLLTHLGPEVDQDGNPIQSPDGTNYFFDNYAMRFSSSLPKPRLDSMRFWFVVDSMDDVAGNAMVISVVKPREDTLTTGQVVPVPNFGVTAAKTLFLSRDSVKDHIGDGQILTQKIDFKGFTVPKNFMIAIGGSVQVSQGVFVSNKIELLTDSVDISGTWDDNADIDTEANRTYYLTLNESETYYQTFFRYFDDRQNTGAFYAPNMFMIAYLHDPTAAVDDAKLEGNALAQNYPNPFNPSTEIKYSLASASNVSVKVYNALGVEVASVVDGYQEAGEHQVSFFGDNLPSGTYFYSMKAGTFSQTKRMVLSK